MKKHEKAMRIFKTIKGNKALLRDPRIALTERRKVEIQQDNMILLNELKKITKER